MAVFVDEATLWMWWLDEDGLLGCRAVVRVEWQQVGSEWSIAKATYHLAGGRVLRSTPAHRTVVLLSVRGSRLDRLKARYPMNATVDELDRSGEMSRCNGAKQHSAGSTASSTEAPNHCRTGTRHTTVECLLIVYLLTAKVNCQFGGLFCVWASGSLG